MAVLNIQIEIRILRQLIHPIFFSQFLPFYKYLAFLFMREASQKLSAGRGPVTLDVCGQCPVNGVFTGYSAPQPRYFPGSPPVFALQDQGSCGFVPLSSSAPLHPVNARLVSDPGSRSQAAHHLMVSATPTSFDDLVTFRFHFNREAGFVSNFPLSEPLIYVPHDIPSPQFWSCHLQPVFARGKIRTYECGATQSEYYSCCFGFILLNSNIPCSFNAPSV